MPHRNGYFRSAQRFLEAAQREFDSARAVLDEIALRQAAEKGWGAAREAVKGLFQKRGLKVPRGTTAIENKLRDLAERDPGVRAEKVHSDFARFMKDLHIDTFGDGVFSVKTIERDLRDLGLFIGLVRRI